MKTVSSELLALLTSATQLCIIDLITFTLTDGTVFRYTTLPYTFKVGSYNYIPFACDIGSLKQSIGFNVDSRDLTVYYNSNDAITLNGSSTTLAKAIRADAFNYAVCEHSQVFMTKWAFSVSETYKMIIWKGRLQVDSASRSVATLKIKSFTDILTTKTPPNLYQPGCINCTYGTVCGLDEDEWTTSYTVLSGSTKNTIYVSCAKEASYYKGGYANFTSGNNYGTSKTIRSHAYNSSTGIATIILMWNLASAPSAGDKVSLIAGCDHTMSLCKSRFDNYDNYRGTPYIPTPYVSV